MKLIENSKKRERVKAKARQRRDRTRAKYKRIFRKKLNKKINQLKAEHSKEIEILIARHKKEHDYKLDQYEKRLKSIREETRREYIITVEELSAEVKRLREYIADNKKSFNRFGEIEFLFGDMIKSVSDKFQRASIKAEESTALMESAKDEADKFARKYLKKDIKLIKEA